MTLIHWFEESNVFRDGIFVDGAQNQDACPMQPGTSWRNGILGCPDSDGDGWWDVQDAFPTEATQHSDVDGDGATSCGGDCDDEDASLGAQSNDLDCDGIENSSDSDADGDAVDEADDCDDLDEALGDVVEDLDCDGVKNTDDSDADGDGALTLDEFKKGTILALLITILKKKITHRC